MMKIDFFVCAQDTSEYVFLAFLGILKHIWSGFERYLAYFQPWIAEFWLLECVFQASKPRNAHLSARERHSKMPN